jgi:ATP-dependent RNA/DNA helicase IGHMBP2
MCLSFIPYTLYLIPYTLLVMSNSMDELKQVKALLAMEKKYDFDLYQEKILTAPLKDKVNEGVTWYPVAINRSYIGTGERMIIEVARTKKTDQSHSFQSGNVIRLFSNTGDDNTSAGGVINYIKGETMVITLNLDDLPEWIHDGKLGVDLMFDEASYKEMENTLNVILKAEKGRIVELREILLGYKTAIFEEMQERKIKELNESQNRALNKVLQAKDVAIIHGPPGTGKTTTLVQAIRETLKTEPQTLVCAASNAAVDLLVEKLTDMGIETLRIGHPARVTEKNLSRTLDARIAEHEHFRDIKKLRKRAVEFRRLAMQYKRKFGQAEREQRKALFMEASRCLADADMLEHYIINDLFARSKVIACTLVGSSNPVLAGKTFQTIFMDEATQALEPAAWIPILKAGRVVFAGDHLQLPPTIKSPEAAKGGLEKTLMEKCAIRTDLAVMLQKQYRMHSDIMGFSSNYFYHNELVADDSVKDRLLAPDDQPVLFIDTAGCGFAEAVNPETKSIFNTEEAHLLLRHLNQYIEQIGLDRIVADQVQIGIISPYKAQVLLLKELIEENVGLQPLLSQIAIDTVDSFQGRERDIIYIGMVRSNDRGEIGFLNDQRRMNVAMTRAKMKLVMIGDSATLGSSKFYNQLLDYVGSLNGYMSAYEV